MNVNYCFIWILIGYELVVIDYYMWFMLLVRVRGCFYGDNRKVLVFIESVIEEYLSFILSFREDFNSGFLVMKEVV